MSARAPLPDPPDPRRPQDPPARLPYPNSYGPSSTIRPQQPVKLNAHEALYGGGGNGGGGGRDALDAAAPAWIPYGKPPGRGSTFFIRGSGTQRLGGALGSSTRPRPPLPTPPLNAPSTSDAQASASFQQPQFTETTSYSPPTSLGAFPPGARPGYGATLRRFPNDDQATTRARAPFGDAVNSPPAGTATTKVPLGGSSSILLHAGFWDLLSATGSRFLSPVGAATGAPPFPANLGETDSFDRGYLGLKPGNGEMASRRVVTGVQGGLGGVQSAAATAASKQGALKKKKRVSVDMVGKPKEFQHLVHASDAEQAEQLLYRWHQDGQGKLGHPSWAGPIKDATRAKVRARGIAEVHANRQESQPVLQIVNGPPSSIAAVEDDAGWSQEGEDIMPLSFPEMHRVGPAQTVHDKAIGGFAEGGTTRFTQGWDRPALPGGRPGGPAPLSFDRPGMLSVSPSPASPVHSASSSQGTVIGDPVEDFIAMPSSFVPSLTTIEKAVGARIFFETKYHNILKKPRDRDQRRERLEAELKRLNLSEAQNETVRAAWALSETEYLREMRSKVTVGSFVKLKTIGHGAFGVVSLVKEQGTGQLYAMKQLRKADMLKKGQEGHVRAERDLLATAATSTRWTVRLAYSFQDVNHLYLVMDFMGGGDLLTLLIERDTFPEDMARFYFAEMVLAVEETHKVLGAIHRDIKPDNFLFDHNGHIRISDFGLATDFHWAHDGAYFDQQRRDLLYKHGIDLEDGSGSPSTTPFDQERIKSHNETPASLLTWRDKHRRRLAYSVVGTNNYMAVEVLRGHGYDQACDWWSLGVILYESLFGYPPFVSKSRNMTRQKIMTWQSSLRFPPRPRISREAQDLITSLICERENRLGSRAASSTSRPNSYIATQRRSGFLAPGSTPTGWGGVWNDGAEEIKAHPFFRGLDFNTIHQQTPPFVPSLDSEADTKYFEDDIDDNPLPAPEIAPGVPAPDTTKDPLLRHAQEGPALLEVRKGVAFQGWTYKKPKRQVYDPRRGIDLSGGVAEEKPRGRPQSRYNPDGSFITAREGPASAIRSLSV